MLKRIITAVVALAAFIPVCIYSHTQIFPIAMAFLCTVGTVEMLRCVGIRHIPVWVSSLIFAVSSPLFVRIAGNTGLFITVFCAAAFCYFSIVSASAVFSHGTLDITAAYTSYAMVLYIVSSFTSIVLLRDSHFGNILYILAFLGPWISDSAAYFCGRAFGHIKLIPDVSPKKTVAGCLGGLVFTGIVFDLYALVAVRYLNVAISPSYPLLFAVGVLVSVISQLGDLIASLVKRRYDIKDYGRIFPGHGGVMDRFDSVLLTAPLLLAVAELSAYINIF